MFTFFTFKESEMSGTGHFVVLLSPYQAQNIFDSTTIVTHSDFARALTPNSSGLGSPQIGEDQQQLIVIELWMGKTW